MFRVLAATIMATAFACTAAPAVADMKIVSAYARQTSQQVKRVHRRQVTALAVPRCRMVRRTSYHVHWRGLACPRIAWAGSAPRQPWSYAVFRHQARWEQRSGLWQSHIRPSRSHPTIYWGY